MSDEYKEIQPKTMKFGGVGDFIAGTLTDVSKTTSPDAYGKLSHVYSVKTDSGSFLASKKNEKTGKYIQDTEPTIIAKDEQYTIFIANDKNVIIGKMKDIKLGQKFKMVFEELKATSKGNDAKIIKVFSGPMDQEYLASKTETVDDIANDFNG